MLDNTGDHITVPVHITAHVFNKVKLRENRWKSHHSNALLNFNNRRCFCWGFAGGQVTDHVNIYASKIYKGCILTVASDATKEIAVST